MSDHLGDANKIVPAWLAGPSEEVVEAAHNSCAIWSDERGLLKKKQAAAILTAAWPLIVRQVVEGCATTVDRLRGTDEHVGDVNPLYDGALQIAAIHIRTLITEARDA